MAQSTLEEDRVVSAFERKLRGEDRVLLHNAPRDLEGVQRLTDWQMYCLASALSLTDASIAVLGKTFDTLPRRLRDRLLVEEIQNYDKSRYTRLDLRDPSRWTEIMQQYLREELRTP